MTPGSFDIGTCKEILGDGLCRRLEDDARKAANKYPFDLDHDGHGEWLPSNGLLTEQCSTYWDQVTSQMQMIVWQTAWGKRLARNARMKKTSTPEGEQS